jgi:hypothetical protein
MMGEIGMDSNPAAVTARIHAGDFVLHLVCHAIEREKASALLCRMFHVNRDTLPRGAPHDSDLGSRQRRRRNRSLCGRSDSEGRREYRIGAV